LGKQGGLEDVAYGPPEIVDDEKYIDI